MQKIKGLELSKKYFQKIYFPIIKSEFPDLLKRMAAGLAGEGSECFGFDDEISRDHDFGPSCCIWLDNDDFKKYGSKLQKRLDELPKEFMGFPIFEESEFGNNRRGVLNIDDWYYKFLNRSSCPQNLYDWRLIPEEFLATATNGEVFLDNLGKFSKIRNDLKNYFPDDIRLKKISARCMKMAQSGQYNYYRCMRRNEIIAARLAESEFISEAIHMIFLLNKTYKPFYKWMSKKMKELPILGEKTYFLIEELVNLPTGAQNRKAEIIEKISMLVISELKRQDLVPRQIPSDFLQDYGFFVQQKISDEKLRNLHPAMD
ncbi:DUF4037 domain-containing protein [Leptotrichia sp. oral taxon 847]|uniref:DUF4037 domain-containing protein n=1 Tax=Leptotrichia sp. oral taxon 847 TaxID=1785996 RepID=UPI0007681BDA|nr:DUF4037 domain-containing protein [Leptotrichia sp. oral taxon 847]AMD94707.1 hypothetical protein AXF11_03285 [Leptotrichia sp. oral taxon 847]